VFLVLEGLGGEEKPDEEGRSQLKETLASKQVSRACGKKKYRGGKNEDELTKAIPGDASIDTAGRVGGSVRVTEKGEKERWGERKTNSPHSRGS